MRIISIIMAAVIALGGLAPGAAAIESQGDYPVDQLQVQVWFDQERGAVYEPGEEIEIYFRSSHDCYVVVYNVDTQGFINVLYPQGDDPTWVESTRIHSVPDSRDDYELVVEGPKGIEYVVATASPYPLDLRALYEVDEEGNRYAGRIVGDPHEALHDLNNRLAWGADDHAPDGYSSDVGWFYVEREVPYPRYLVYHWYHDRFWDPLWDPYVDVYVFTDYRWDHRWCRPWYWCYGCRPVYNYWYVEVSGGPRVKWKHWHHHDVGHADWHRVKPPRRVVRGKTVKPRVIPRKVTQPRLPKAVRYSPDIYRSKQHKPRKAKPARRGQAPKVGVRPGSHRIPAVKPQARPAAKPAKVKKPEKKPEPKAKPKAKPEKAEPKKADAKPAKKPAPKRESKRPGKR